MSTEKKAINKPRFITFTGIDDRTNLDRADALGEKYPIEWGVLHSMRNRDSRFPSNGAINEMLCLTSDCAAHLCGGLARQAADPDNGVSQTFRNFQRIQINGNYPLRNISTVAKDAYDELKIQVIRQTQNTEFLPLGKSDCLELYDVSGRRGIYPKNLPSLPVAKLAGYAGGITPDNVMEFIRRIGPGAYWIDVESGVRTGDWFDLNKVKAICEQVYQN